MYIVAMNWLALSGAVYILCLIVGWLETRVTGHYQEKPSMFVIGLGAAIILLLKAIG